MMRFNWKTMVYRGWQCTWGGLQSALGLLAFLLHGKERHYRYHGAVVTECRSEFNISLGMFVFVAENQQGAETEQFRRLLLHEYGHTVQSLLLGPLYLLVIGLPSLMWCRLPYFKRKRKKQGGSYYSFYTEKWADALGTWAEKRWNSQKVL